MIQVIKSSRAILILFILYLCISIAVVTLNAASKKKDKEESSSKTQEKTTTTSYDVNVVQDEINDIAKLIETYVVAEETNGTLSTSGTYCISLSDTLDYQKNNKYTTGSVYYNNGEKTIWFTDGDHYISEFKFGDTLTEDDISSGFLTEYYNTCGAE